MKGFNEKMQQRSRFTIQEILDDVRMTSTTATRPPVKAKSLTLLELCQTINDLHHTTSRNTAQILTRRLYLHPLTISTNAKQHTTKVITNNLLEIEDFNRILLEKQHSPSPSKRPLYRGLSILSSSFPLSPRPNTKLTASLNADHDTSIELEGITTNNPVSLPPIYRMPTSLSSSSKRTISTRSSFISVQSKSKSTPPTERIDVWRHLAQALQRPVPKDPPTTPLGTYPDLHLHDTPPLFNTIKRMTRYDSPIAEDDG